MPMQGAQTMLDLTRVTVTEVLVGMVQHVRMLTNAQQTPITVMPSQHVQIRSAHSIVHVT